MPGLVAWACDSERLLCTCRFLLNTVRAGVKDRGWGSPSAGQMESRNRPPHCGWGGQDLCEMFKVEALVSCVATQLLYVQFFITINVFVREQITIRWLINDILKLEACSSLQDFTKGGRVVFVLHLRSLPLSQTHNFHVRAQCFSLSDIFCWTNTFSNPKGSVPVTRWCSGNSKKNIQSGVSSWFIRKLTVI